MIPIATRVDRSVLTELQAIAKAEYCQVSFVVRRAISNIVTGEASEHLMKSVTRPKDPVGVTVMVDSPQRDKVIALADDLNCSISDLLRVAINRFLVFYRKHKELTIPSTPPKNNFHDRRG